MDNLAETKEPPVSTEKPSDSSNLRIKEFIAGNLDWPQTTGGGSSLYMAHSLVENPPHSWKEFAQAQVTSADRDEIMMAMTKHHQGRGINVVHPKLATETQKSPTDERIDMLYDSARREALLPIFRFVAWAQGRNLDRLIRGGDSLNEEELANIESFMNNPKNASKVKMLKAMLKQTYDEVTKPTNARQLNLAFKATLSKEVPFSKWLSLHPLHQQILTKNEIPIDATPHDVRRYSVYILRETVSTSVSAKFPKAPVPTIIGRVLPRVA